MTTMPRWLALGGGLFARKAEFRYTGDGLFMVAVVLYLLNRFLLKPACAAHTGFFQSYFNDLLCVPFWLPLVLLLTRRIGFRDHDRPPDLWEIGFYLTIWSIVFELLCPLRAELFHDTVADPWDVVCYAAGALLGGLHWNFGWRGARSST
jgi:hypothetical protein